MAKRLLNRHFLGAVLLGGMTSVLAPGLGWAQATLSVTQLNDIGAALSSTITKAEQALPPGTSQERADAAVAKAIATLLEAEIGAYGPGMAGALTEAVVVDAMTDGASPTAIGAGMAEAALEEASANGDTVCKGTAIDAEIAAAVGNAGNSAIVAKFDATAVLCAGTADTSEEIAAGGSSPIGPGRGNGSGTPTPCPNPSCT